MNISKRYLILQSYPLLITANVLSLNSFDEFKKWKSLYNVYFCKKRSIPSSAFSVWIIKKASFRGWLNKERHEFFSNQSIPNRSLISKRSTGCCYTQCQFIRNTVKSQLVPFLIFCSFLTSLRFLISKLYIVTVS